MIHIYIYIQLYMYKYIYIYIYQYKSQYSQSERWLASVTCFYFSFFGRWPLPMIVVTLWHSSAIWFADFPSYKPPFCFRISNQPCLIAKEYVCPGQEMAYGLWSSVINRPIVRICKNPIESLQWVYINPY